MIKDDEIEKAVDYLAQSAKPAAKAHAESNYMADYTKVVRAELMNECNDLPINAQEAYAYRQLRYREHLEAKRTADFEHFHHRHLREAAQTKVDAWQTQSATERAIKL